MAVCPAAGLDVLSSPVKASHLPTTVTDTAHSNGDEFVRPTPSIGSR
jgi:hypothetical protein